MEILIYNSVCVGFSQNVYKPSAKKLAICSFGKGVHSSSTEFYTMPEGPFSFREALTAVMNGITWEEGISRCLNRSSFFL